MPRPKDERTPLDILAEVENNVKGLKKMLESEQGLYEMNMALAMVLVHMFGIMLKLYLICFLKWKEH